MLTGVARAMKCVSEEDNVVEMLTSDITINAGDYQGTYSVKGMTGCCFNYGTTETYSELSSGSRTVAIQYTEDASRQWSRIVSIHIGQARFYFSLDTNGRIVYVSNPHVAVVSEDGMTLTLNSVFITINLGNMPDLGLSVVIHFSRDHKHYLLSHIYSIISPLDQIGILLTWDRPGQ